MLGVGGVDVPVPLETLHLAHDDGELLLQHCQHDLRVGLHELVGEFTKLIPHLVVVLSLWTNLDVLSLGDFGLRKVFTLGYLYLPLLALDFFI